MKDIRDFPIEADLIKYYLDLDRSLEEEERREKIRERHYITEMAREFCGDKWEEYIEAMLIACEEGRILKFNLMLDDLIDEVIKRQDKAQASAKVESQIDDDK